MNGSRDASAAVNKTLTGEGVDRHDGCITQEASKLDGITYGLAHHRDDTDGGSLLIDHPSSLGR